ncbi:MAG: acetate--CoA ligase [Deltaproteobacteria bacterium]|nr:MAG: acetate--CoA ligase [Deltaproteobacteria bacterium]
MPLRTFLDEFKSYEEAREKFKWSDRWKVFDGNKDNFNIAHECVDRHPKEDVAIRIKFADDRREEIYKFKEFSEATSQFANFLAGRGIEKGDRVALLLHPRFEFYVGMFGTFKRGAIVIPCSPLFGPEAVAYRLEKGGAKAILTTKDKTDLIPEETKKKLNLQIIYADNLLDEISKESTEFTPNTTANDMAMYQFSSGTTGAPKIVNYRHGAITVAAPFVRFAVGITADDNYFCPSSPAWGHGIWYGTIAPLIFGVAIGAYSGKFDPDVCLEALQNFEITNISAIASHYRLMVTSPNVDKYKLKLKKLTYTGEAMPKDIIELIQKKWGVTPYVLYGTTEVGPLTCDFAGFENWKPKPGSLGKPSIGSEVEVIDEEGNICPPGKVGQMAIKRGDKWIRVGDLVYKDEDGYFWYVGRADDVIISAGYTIGPIEVEEAIMKHPAVQECAVVGSPDKERGNIVKAFIKVKEGYTPSPELAEEIKEFVKDKLSKHEYPREIEFIDELSKTPDGKIRRKVLREREIERKKKMGVI